MSPHGTALAQQAHPAPASLEKSGHVPTDKQTPPYVYILVVQPYLVNSFITSNSSLSYCLLGPIPEIFKKSLSIKLLCNV